MARTIDRPKTGLRRKLPRTEEEFVRWCDEDVRAEFVDGKVLIMSPATLKHVRLQFFLHTLIDRFVKRHNLGEVLGPELQVRLRPGLRRVPDILFVAKQRSGILLEHHVEGPPDAVFEVVSPDSVRRDYEDKLEEYAAQGVHEYWIIDPLTRRVTLYSLKNGEFVRIRAQGGWIHSRVLEGFRLRPEWLWQEPLPDPMDLIGEVEGAGNEP